jgi:hypothetical protein
MSGSVCQDDCQRAGVEPAFIFAITLDANEHLLRKPITACLSFVELLFPYHSDRNSYINDHSTLTEVEGPRW